MAALTVTTLTEANTSGNVTWDAITVDQADTIDLEGIASERFVVLINNSSTVAGTATFSEGDLYEGSALGDLAVTIPASGEIALTLETSRFKDSDDDVTITVTSTGATTGTLAAVQLPL
jgi:hypothetical protein